MVRPTLWAGRSAAGLARIVTMLALAIAGIAGAGPSAAAQDDGAAIRVVHGVSDSGPVDLYLDGRLAVVGAAFPGVTDPLAVAGGDRRIQVTASGAGLETAFVDSVVTVAAGATLEIALVGSAAEVLAVLYPVDAAPLDGDRARLRVVHGSPDAGPLDVAFLGGDAIFPTVEYLTATEYAEVPAGVYALDVRSPGAEAATASIPELVLAPGEVVDVHLVGQVADGSIQPLAVRTVVPIVPVVGRAAAIRSGTCAAPGAVVAQLGIVAAPRGAAVGAAAGDPVANGFANAAVSLDDAVAAPHVVAIADSDAEDAAVVACGPVAGVLTDDGALAIPLADADGTPLGIAVLAAGVLDPATLDVSVFLLPAPTSSATDPEPESTPAPPSAPEAGSAAGPSGAGGAVRIDDAAGTPPAGA